MTITITVEDKTNGGQVIEASRALLELEIDYAGFDVVCHTVKKLREEVEAEKAKYLSEPWTD